MAFIQNTQLLKLGYGNGPVSKASGASPTTVTCFTIAGGEVLITALWLKVTTAVTTDTGSLSVTNVPTTGTTTTIVTATDLGTTDTAAGSVVGLDRGTTAVTKFLMGGRIDLLAVVTTGTIVLNGTNSVNGAVTVNVMWEALTDGATLA